MKPLKRKSIKYPPKKKNLASFLAVNYLSIISDYSPTHLILKPTHFPRHLRTYTIKPQFIRHRLGLLQEIPRYSEAITWLIAALCRHPPTPWWQKTSAPFLAIIVPTHTRHFRAACYIRE